MARIGFVGVVLGVALLIVWVATSPGSEPAAVDPARDDTPLERAGAPRLEPAPHRDPEPTRVPPAEAEVSRRHVRFAGRVLGAGRFPAVGVPVVLRVEAREAGRTGTTSDGSFALEADVSEDAAWVGYALEAADAAGRLALRNGSLRSGEVEQTGIVLVLGEAFPLAVEVTFEDAPVAGARVDAWAEGARRQGHVAAATTDRSGTARFDRLPREPFWLTLSAEGLADASLWAPVPMPEGRALRVALERPRTVEVQVVEAPDMTPMSGVAIELFERAAYGRRTMHRRHEPQRTIPPTDASGRTRIDGLGRGLGARLGVRVRGYANRAWWPGGDAERVDYEPYVDVPADADTVRVVVPAARRISWPIGSGTAGVPVDTEDVRLAVDPHSVVPCGMAVARIAGGRLVVEEARPGRFHALAVLADGRQAMLDAPPGATHGPQVMFEEVGAPPDAPAVERRRLPVVVHVRLGSRPALPDEYTLRVQDGGIHVLDEDPVSGELRAEWEGDAAVERTTVTFRTPGFQTARVPLVPTSGRLDLALQPAGRLVLRILEEPGEPGRWRLEREDARTRAWRLVELDVSSEQPLPSPDVGVRYLFRTLAPGFYRAADRRDAARTTHPVAVTAGPKPAELTLDLRWAAAIAGRVEAPPGTDWSRVRLEAGSPRSGAPLARVALRPGGRFRIRWPEKGGLRVRVSHPDLRADAERGDVVLTAPREDVVLRLLEATPTTVRLRLPDGASLRSGSTRTVVFFADRVAGRGIASAPATILRLDDGTPAFRFVRPDVEAGGLFVDLDATLAPLVLEDLDLSDDGSELGPVPVRAGATLRLRFRTADGRPPRTMVVRATREGAPTYERVGVSEDRETLDLTGLGAGRFRLRGGRLGPAMEEQDEIDRIVEVSGEGVQEVGIDLP